MNNKYLSILSGLLIMVITASCGNKNGNSTGKGVDADLEDAISKAENRRDADPDAKGGNICLLNYQEKYDQLLTEEMVLDATGFSKDVIKIKYSKALKNPEYHSVSYRFANKRIGKVKEVGIEMELNDDVVLKSIKPLSLNQFKDTYRVVSQQERDLANQKIDDAVEGRSEDPEANAKIKELDKMGVDKKTTKGAANMIKDAFSNVAKSYRNVEGLGDAATWNTHTNTLNVLQNGVQFELYVEVSNEQEKNRKVAIDIAGKLLDRCK